MWALHSSVVWLFVLWTWMRLLFSLFYISLFFCLLLVIMNIKAPNHPSAKADSVSDKGWHHSRMSPLKSSWEIYLFQPPLPLNIIIVGRLARLHWYWVGCVLHVTNATRPLERSSKLMVIASSNSGLFSLNCSFLQSKIMHDLIMQRFTWRCPHCQGHFWNVKQFSLCIRCGRQDDPLFALQTCIRPNTCWSFCQTK